jgi:hypothetical protein
VRVLGTPRPRRPAGSGVPAPAAPGTAEVGARHIEPGETGTSAWMARTLAIAALAFVAVALLLLLKLA